MVQIPYVFSNTDQTTISPLGEDPSHLKLGHLMARMWVSFASDLNPNGHKGRVVNPGLLGVG